MISLVSYERLLRHTSSGSQSTESPLSKKCCRGSPAALAGGENEQSENAAASSAVDTDAILGQLGRGLVALLIARLLRGVRAGAPAGLAVRCETPLMRRRPGGESLARTNGAPTAARDRCSRRISDRR